MGVNSSVQLQTMLSQFGMLRLGNVTERTDSRVLYSKYSSIHETGKNLMGKLKSPKISSKNTQERILQGCHILEKILEILEKLLSFSEHLGGSFIEKSSNFENYPWNPWIIHSMLGGAKCFYLSHIDQNSGSMALLCSIFTWLGSSLGFLENHGKILEITLNYP